MDEFAAKRNINLNLSKYDIEYYLFYIIVEFGQALNIGSSNKNFMIFAATAILFLVYKIINTKYTYKELFMIVSLSILGLLIYLITRKSGGILSIIAIIGLKDVNLKKLLKLSFYLRLLAFSLLILLTSFGVVKNTIITHIRGNETVIRYSMGFTHPNQFHIAFITLLLLVIYIYYEDIKIFHLFLLGVINTLIYFISYSRTSTVIGFIALFMTIWFKLNYFNRLKMIFCRGIIPFCFLISLIPALMYEKIPGIRSIDRLFQWRITFSRHYLTTYPLGLFGNNLNKDVVILDSGYVELIINYGIIFTFLYLISFIILINRYTNQKMYRELLLIVCLSIYGITEAFIPNLFTNLSLVFISDIIFHKTEKLKDELKDELLGE